MAGKYTPLRVPIILLHQKVYNTGRRLPHWEPLPKKVVAPAPVIITRSEPVIAFGEDVFERIPYLRRYWYKVGTHSMKCRVCDQLVYTEYERRGHTECQLQLTYALTKLEAAKVCVICEDHFENRTYKLLETQHLPICSKLCLDTWDRMNPTAVSLVVEVVKNDREKNSAVR